MKCQICGKEMKNTVGGCYSCGCGSGINDAVYRPNGTTGNVPSDWNNKSFIIGNQGWICPKCGAGIAPHMTYCPLCAPAQEIKITYGGSPYNTTDTQYTTISNGGSNDK